MCNIDIFELVSIDIFIDLNQRCVGFEKIIFFIANMIPFNFQYFIIIPWCTVYITIRVKDASIPLIISIITISNLWHFLRSCIEFNYFIRIGWNSVHITIFIDNTTTIYLPSPYLDKSSPTKDVISVAISIFNHLLCWQRTP